MKVVSQAAAQTMVNRADLQLVGYWNFDTQASPGLDSSGKGNNGQVSKATWIANGRSAGALYFNGTDALVTIPNGAWNLGNPVSYNLWYKSDGSPVGYLVEHELATRNAGAFAISPAGKFSNYDSSRKVRDVPFTASAGSTWSMVTVVVNGSTLKVYKNGVPVGTTTRTLSKLVGALHVGASAANANAFRGWIDEVAVFGRALTDAQVSDVYKMYPPVSTSSGVPPEGISAPLVARWSFDDGSAADGSGHHFDGVVAGAAPADDGRFGGALYFDGKSHVRIPASDWNIAAPVTYNVWFKSDVAIDKDKGKVDNGFVFNHILGWQSAGSFALTTQESITFTAFDGNNNEIGFTDGVSTPTSWVMFTAVFAADTLRLYKDGALWKSLPMAGFPGVAETDLYIGASDDAKWGFFHGWIDEVSIYAGALSDGDVKILAGGPKNCPDTNHDGKPDCPVPDLSACVDAIAPRTDLTDAARDIAFETEIQRRCVDPTASDCLSELRARINLDYTAAAISVTTAAKTPSQLLAVDLDRERKAKRFESDAVFAARLCAGPDDDGDFIVNADDQCPDTPALTPTDDLGCTDPKLPPGPSADDVNKVLEKKGFVINPACSKAIILPSTTIGPFIKPQAPDQGVFILAGRVSNQPPDCPVWYVFEVQEMALNSNGSGYTEVADGRYIISYQAREEVTALFGNSAPVPINLIQFNAGPTDPGTRGRLASRNTYTPRMRVKVMNGGGMQSGWSAWQMPSPEDCKLVPYAGCQ